MLRRATRLRLVPSLLIDEASPRFPPRVETDTSRLLLHDIPLENTSKREWSRHQLL